MELNRVGADQAQLAWSRIQPPAAPLTDIKPILIDLVGWNHAERSFNPKTPHRIDRWPDGEALLERPLPRTSIEGSKFPYADKNRHDCTSVCISNENLDPDGLAINRPKADERLDGMQGTTFKRLAR
jgi:hypothetical protein